MTTLFHAMNILSLILLSLAIVFVFIRLLLGPSLADRVAALDVMSTLAICVIAVYAMFADRAIYLDIVIALALVTFLGTIAFAQYIEYQLGKKEVNDD